MRVSLVLVVVLVCGTLVVDGDSKDGDKKPFHCCSSVFAGFCPHCYACPFTATPLENIEKLLTERIFGQEEAINTILTAFKAHDKKKPLTFHLAGDNGVGKSFTAKTIAEALFQQGNPSHGDFKGFLYLRGEQFQGIAQAEEYRQTITRLIVEQLAECPNSLIVFDEVEYLAPQTVSAVSAFLDDSIPTFQYTDKIKCRTNEATFMVISDFGTEGKTDKMSFQEVKTLVERDSKEFWANPKQPSVITYVVPFMTLDAEARAKTATYQLSRLAHLNTFTSRNVKGLVFAPGGAEAVAHLSNLAYPAQNGRGVTKYVESYVIPQVVAAIDKHEAAHAAYVQTLQTHDKEHTNTKEKEGQKKRTILVTVAARQPLGEFHKAKFDVKVEEAEDVPTKRGWWSGWSINSKTEL